MENERFVWIAAIVLIGTLFLAYIIVGTDVFAQDTISEAGATNIVNNFINNTTSIYPTEAKNFQVGTPKKVKQNGIMVWLVPVTYIGTNKAISSKFNGNLVIPTQGTKDAKGQLNIIVKLPDNSTVSITTTKDGHMVVIAITTPILPTSTTNQQTNQQSTSKQSTSNQNTNNKQNTNQQNGNGYVSPDPWIDQNGNYHAHGSPVG